MSFSKLDYCQYLLSSQVNYTLTHLADHLQRFSHDTINRYLSGQKLSPRLLWESVRDKVTLSQHAYVLFDDTVLDKSFGPKIELTRKQWSGNEHRVIRGMGLVSCVYLNAATAEFWVLDYRLYNPDGDGKSKLDHVLEMLSSLQARQVPFATVLMDAWYAAKPLMACIDNMGKVYYCPIKSNRLVNDSGGARPNQPVEQLSWTPSELRQGKIVHLKDFPKDKLVKLFRIKVSTHQPEAGQTVSAKERLEWIVTNDLSQTSAQDAQEVSALRWKIEQYHREIKQLTGIESCQCRKARIQRNHIACALLVWTRLKHLSYQYGQTVYQLKRGLLSDYLIQQLKNPSIRMTFA